MRRNRHTTRQLAAKHVRLDHTAGGVTDAWDAAVASADAQADADDDAQRVSQAADAGRVTLDGASDADDGADGGDGSGGDAGAVDTADDARVAELTRVCLEASAIDRLEGFIAGGQTVEQARAALASQPSLTADRERSASITTICLEAGASDRIAGFINSDSTPDDVRRELWNRRADGHADQPRLGAVSQDHRQTSEGRFARGLSDAMIERAGSSLVGQVERFERERYGDQAQRVDGAEFRGLRLSQMGRLCLQRSGIRVPEVDDHAIARLLFEQAGHFQREQFTAIRNNPEAVALYSRERAGFDSSGRVTLDYGLPGTQGRDQFPNVLTDAMHRVLHASFSGDMAQRYIWRQFCQIGSASDFRPHHHYFVGGLPDMPTKGEGGEYETTQLGDGEAGQVVVTEHGYKVRISRETVINDDLGRIMMTVGHMGIASNRTVENLLFAQLGLNSNDGPAVNGATMFSTGRSNKLTGALTDDTLNAAQVALRTQASVGDHDFVDLNGDSVLVHPTNNALMRTINGDGLQRGGSGGPNLTGVMGSLRNILSSPRVATNTRWYTWDSMASPWMASFLRGRDEPYLQQMESWGMEGTCYLGALDVGVAALNYRGMILSTGA